MAMSEAYRCIFQTYQRKLGKVVEQLRPNSAEGKALCALCAALDIDGDFKQLGFVDLLARLRALEMVQAPH